MTITAPTWTDAARRPRLLAGLDTRMGTRFHGAGGRGGTWFDASADRPMTSFGAPAVARPRGMGALLGGLSPRSQVIAALALMSLLQLAALPTQNPVNAVVSFLVFAPGGIVLFPLASGLIALAVFTWAGQLSRLGRSWAARFAGAAGISLLLLGAFPTDPPEAAGISLSAQVHRYAALAMFIAIPAAAILATRALKGADRADRRRLGALRAAVTICLLTALPALLPIFPALLPEGWQPLATACHAVRGLVERIQLVTMMVIVILGVALSRGTGGRKRGGLDPLSRAVPAATMVG